MNIDKIDENLTSTYVFIGYGSILAVSILLVLSFFDITFYTIAKAIQDISLRLNPNLFNKESVDYSLLRYRTNTKDDEPYNIYLQQQITVWIYMFLGVIIVYVFLHKIIILTLRGVVALSSKEPSKTGGGSMISDEIKEAAFFVIIMVVLALSYNMFYTSRFEKRIKPDVIDISASIKSITDATYDSLSTDEAFLKSVLEGSLDESYKIINRQGNRADTIGSMIFTMCLYSYYKHNTDIMTNENIKQMFTRDEIRLRRISPFDYLYYNQTSFIPNLYQSIEPHIKQVLNTSSKRAAVRQNVASRLNNVNRKLVKMFRMSMIQSGVFAYLTMCFLASLTAALIIVFSKFRDKIWNNKNASKK